MLNFDEIRTRINNREYENKKPYKRGKIAEKNILTPINPVYDEKLTIDELRKKTKEYNAEIDKIQDEYSKENMRIYASFKNDVENVIIKKSLNKLNKEQAKVIFSKAYADMHSGGYYEVVNYAEELLDFVETIIDKG